PDHARLRLLGGEPAPRALRARGRAGLDRLREALVNAGYSGTPLPKKLGIKPESTVALVDAPDGFEELLGPTDATLRRGARGRVDLAIWFVRSARDLRRERVARLGAPLWIAWPKQASGLAPDLSENVVREAGLACGFVDTKVAAIDETWSGLLFRMR